MNKLKMMIILIDLIFSVTLSDSAMLKVLFSVPLDDQDWQFRQD